jgi:hypothetical protein
VAYLTHSSESRDQPTEQTMDLVHESDELGPGAAPGSAHSAGPRAATPRPSGKSGIDLEAPRGHGDLPPSNQRPYARTKLGKRLNAPRHNPGSS